jgi:hypothetical protein
MSSKDFIVFSGKFICKECHKDVNSARLWSASGDVTWMCFDKHLSKVGLIPQKKKKKDFINE